jgi:hypothetical protein
MASHCFASSSRLKDGKNQESVEASQEDKKKRRRTGKGKTGRQEEEEKKKVFEASKKTAMSPEVENKVGRKI